MEIVIDKLNEADLQTIQEIVIIKNYGLNLVVEKNGNDYSVKIFSVLSETSVIDIETFIALSRNLNLKN